MSSKIVSYSMKVAKKVCKAIESSVLGIADLCAENKDDVDFPAVTTYYNWQNRYPQFRKMLRESRKKQMRLRKEHLMDTIYSDTLPARISDRDGNERYDPAYINLLRLRFETLNSIDKKLQSDTTPPMIVNYGEFKLQPPVKLYDKKQKKGKK